jgi:hypothetical protein
LALQRQELEQTRAELRGQKEQLEAQNRTFRQQTFENTFFQLLRLHNEIVDSLVIKAYSGHQTIRGREGIARLYRELNLVSTRRATNDKEALEEINAVYEKFYDQNRGHLSHYLRNLLALLEFVANSAIENPGLYSNVVRAQLSTSEISLLFYTGLSDLGNNKFKPLIERFSLLEGLVKESVADTTYLELYEPQAYGQPSVSR